MNSDSRTPRRATPSRDDILHEVAQIVAEQLGMEATRIRESDSLVDDLGCDSLDIVEISMELEEQFDVSIPEEFAETARTIGDVTDGLLRLLAQVAR